MLFASKLITSSGNTILNICDPDLVNKIIKDGNTEIKISSSYYKENIIDEIEAENLLQKCTSANMVGENIISLSIKLGIGSERGIRRIDGIPFLIIFKMWSSQLYTKNIVLSCGKTKSTEWKCIKRN